MKIKINSYIEQKLNIKENIEIKRIIFDNYLIEKIHIEDSRTNG